MITRLRFANITTNGEFMKKIFNFEFVLANGERLQRPIDAKDVAHAWEFVGLYIMARNKVWSVISVNFLGVEE